MLYQLLCFMYYQTVIIGTYNCSIILEDAATMTIPNMQAVFTNFQSTWNNASPLVRLVKWNCLVIIFKKITKEEEQNTLFEPVKVYKFSISDFSVSAVILFVFVYLSDLSDLWTLRAVFVSVCIFVYFQTWQQTIAGGQYAQ